MDFRLVLHQMVGYLKTAYKVAVIVLVCFIVLNLSFYFINRDRIQTSNKTHGIDAASAMRREIYETINNPEFQKTDVGKSVLGIYRMSLCGLIGEGCTDKPSDGDKNYGHSVFGKLTHAVSMPYSAPPASGIYWVSASLEKAGLVPKTYAAQGIGFSALSPLSGVWKLFRDLAFSVLVIYLIVSGLLIMFRFRINPQTVITIENSLPRVFITLLLITFSFAIAGFLIDAMYVVSALVVSIVGGYSPRGDGTAYLSPQAQTQLVTQGGWRRLFDEVFWNWNVIKLGWDFFSIAPLHVNILLRAIVSLLVIMLLRSTPLDDLITGRVADIPTWAGGIPKLLFGSFVWLALLPILTVIGPLLLGLIILLFSGLYIFIRILALLFAAYLRILINVIFSPMTLLLGVLPGRSMVGNWIKTLLADLVVFPIVMVMIVLSGVMAEIPVDRAQFWQPPFLYSAINPGAFRAILSLGILFLIPQVVKSVRGLLGIKPMGFSMGAGLFFAGLTGLGTGGLGMMSKYGSIAHGAAGLARFGPLGKIFGPIAGGGGHGGGTAHAGGPPSAKGPGRWAQNWMSRNVDTRHSRRDVRAEKQNS